MTDNMGQYTGGRQHKHISKKEIEKMKKNMKKIPEIKKKSDLYHEIESQEADKILKKLGEIK